MRIPRVLALLALVLTTWSAPAFAQGDEVQRYLTAAARLYENLEYERALEQLARAKRYGEGVEDDVAIALYEGIILADMGRKEEATAAFKTGLLLKPDVKLPVKVSPKVARDFEAMRAEVRKELAPILAKQEAERKRKEQERVEAERRAEIERRAEADRRAEAERRAEDERRRRREQERNRAVLANPDVQVKERDQRFTVAEEKGPPPQVLPFLFTGTAVVAGGVGAVFGYLAGQKITEATEAQFFDQQYAALAQAGRQATVANILFATAGAAALGAITGFIFGGGSDSARDTKAASR